MDHNLVFLYVDLPAAGKWHFDAYVFSGDMETFKKEKMRGVLSHLLRCFTSLTPLLRWMNMAHNRLGDKVVVLRWIIP
jgi:hypothetical protein